MLKGGTMSANAFIFSLKQLGVKLNHADGERLLIGLKVTENASLTTGRRAVVHYSDFLKFIAKHTSLLKKQGTTNASSINIRDVAGDVYSARDDEVTNRVKSLRNALREQLQRHSLTNGKEVLNKKNKLMGIL